MADFRVSAHFHPFLSSKLPGLEQNRIRDADFSDVVQHSAPAHRLHRAHAHVHDVGQMHRIFAHPFRVCQRLVLTRVKRSYKRFQSFLGSFLETPQRVTQRQASLFNGLLQVPEVACLLAILIVFFQSPADARFHVFQTKGFQNIVQRTHLHRIYGQ